MHLVGILSFAQDGEMRGKKVINVDTSYDGSSPESSVCANLAKLTVNRHTFPVPHPSVSTRVRELILYKKFCQTKLNFVLVAIL